LKIGVGQWAVRPTKFRYNNPTKKGKYEISSVYLAVVEDALKYFRVEF